MTDQRIQAVEADPGQEIRFEIERSARHTRVSVRVWSSLSGISDKVATGKGFSIDSSRFGAFKEAVLRIERALDVPAGAHE